MSVEGLLMLAPDEEDEVADVGVAKGTGARGRTASSFLTERVRVYRKAKVEVGWLCCCCCCCWSSLTLCAASVELLGQNCDRARRASEMYS